MSMLVPLNRHQRRLEKAAAYRSAKNPPRTFFVSAANGICRMAHSRKLRHALKEAQRYAIDMDCSSTLLSDKLCVLARFTHLVPARFVQRVPRSLPRMD